MSVYGRHCVCERERKRESHRKDESESRAVRTNMFQCGKADGQTIANEKSSPKMWNEYALCVLLVYAWRMYFAATIMTHPLLNYVQRMLTGR